MADPIKVKVPDIGDFENVPVIEILVAEGDSVEAEQSLVTLESDKATMEVPAPVAGVIQSVEVSLNDAVNEGDVIVTIAPDETAGAGQAVEGERSRRVRDKEPETPSAVSRRDSETQATDADTKASAKDAEDAEAKVSAEDDVGAAASRGTDTQDGADFDFDVLVLGSGPGGYTAAFRAADLGLRTALVERYPTLGGVCLNVGCIPSKALLHTAQVMDEVQAMADHGIRYGDPEIDLDVLRDFKDGVVDKLTAGLAGMAKKRKVEIITGTGTLQGAHEIEVKGEEITTATFANLIVAVGSSSVELPDMPWDDPRLMDSTTALELHDIPERLLVIGGGIIGLELACVYSALGSAVTVVELLPQLMTGADQDLVKPLITRIRKRYDAVYTETRVTEITATDDGLLARFEGESAPEESTYDRVLVAVGRVPNGHNFGAGSAGLQITEKGFIEVDRQMRTNVPHIFAIGDVVGQPMLAHKATHEAKVAAEVCAGHKAGFDARVIPSVAYTDPEVAWVGVTEAEAKESDADFGVAKFPWAASGRALGIDRAEGFTKLIFDQNSKRIIGAGIVGPHAGDLISECALAIEMGCEAGDIGLTIHPHPTLSESVAMAAEVFEGTVTDLYMPKQEK